MPEEKDTQQQNLRCFLCATEAKGDLVVRFQFNPAQITDRRSVNYATLNAPGLLMPIRQYISGGDRTISFTVHVDSRFNRLAETATNKSGPPPPVVIATDKNGNITPELNKYRASLYPQDAASLTNVSNSFVDIYKDKPAPLFTNPPICLFGMGNETINCIVTEVNITETLFNAQLEPLRADIALTLVEIVPYEGLPTPPPAGGS
jgi:hypothetical protein